MALLAVACGEVAASDAAPAPSGWSADILCAQGCTGKVVSLSAGCR